jgi:hypothetical protein
VRAFKIFSASFWQLGSLLPIAHIAVYYKGPFFYYIQLLAMAQAVANGAVNFLNTDLVFFL